MARLPLAEWLWGGRAVWPEPSISSDSYLALTRRAPCPNLAGKVHGSLARAGKVRGQTPKVAKGEKKKMITGRAKKRLQYNRR